MADSMVSELLEVLAKWNEVVVFERYEWNGKELSLFVRVKETTKPDKE